MFDLNLEEEENLLNSVSTEVITSEYEGIDRTTITCIELDSINDILETIIVKEGYDNSINTLMSTANYKFFNELSYIIEVAAAGQDESKSQEEKEKSVEKSSGMLSKLVSKLGSIFSNKYTLFEAAKKKIINNTKGDKKSKAIIKKLGEIDDSLSNFKDIADMMINLYNKNTNYGWEFIKLWFSFFIVGLVFFAFTHPIFYIPKLIMSLVVYIFGFKGNKLTAKAKAAEKKADETYEGIIENVIELSNSTDASDINISLSTILTHSKDNYERLDKAAKKLKSRLA